MREIDQTTAEQYLRDSGRIGANQHVGVRALTGGVSNVVLLVTHESEVTPRSFVLKQARGRLRVAEPWYCSVERIWRETDVLTACARLLEPLQTVASGLHPAVPSILFEDRANYLFAMSAVSPSPQVWKSLLLAGEIQPEVAVASGRLMAALHAGSWGDATLARELADREYFDQLRVDPYYRHLARRDSTLSGAIDRLVDSLSRHACGLVHGDFSPKNLLVTPDRSALTLVDFEVGHYGDIAFDIGFFLSHLVLKTFRSGRGWRPMLELISQFWAVYRPLMAARLERDELESLEARGLLHLSACGLARLDGKSPVEYLPDDALRDTIRRLFRQTLESPSDHWDAWERRLVACLPDGES